MHPRTAALLSRLLAGVLASVAALGCGCVASETGEAPALAQQKEEIVDIPVPSVLLLDLLLVIDNSESMRDEQANLGKLLSNVVDALAGREGGLPDLHIGVVTSDLGVGPQAGSVAGCDEEGGDRGAFRATDANGEWCLSGGEEGLGRYFIVDETIFDCDYQTNPSCRRKNYSGELKDALACLANVGTGGCEMEQHLQAMKQALDNSNPENIGFLREDALLAVVIVADEDDCSARNRVVFAPQEDSAKSRLGPLSFRCTEHGVRCDGANLSRAAGKYEDCEPRGDSYLFHPREYLELLKGLKSNWWQRRIVIAGVTGPAEPFEVRLHDDVPELAPSCGEAEPVLAYPQPAVPGVRIRWLVDQFNPPNAPAHNGRNLEICDENPRVFVSTGWLPHRLANPCIQGVVENQDIDESRPGLQLECQVSYHSPWIGDRSIRRCDMDPADPTEPAPGNVLPCWHAVRDEECCGNYPSRLAIKVRAAAANTDPGLRIIARCAVGDQAQSSQ
ncbi:MAG: hypothetical protein V2A73_18670 [Pseudomonadota bacterium]